MKLRVNIFDYGAGNLHSLLKAVELSGATVNVEADPLRVTDCDLLVLPGVGAFGLAAARLAPGREVVRSAVAAGLPCLGICLGMQLLFDGSEEGEGEGLGIIAGRVTKLEARRVPQIGWNTLEDVRDRAVEAARLETAYFANGYACRPDDSGVVTAWATHEGDRFPAVVRSGSAVGTQFHPEKSSTQGVAFIRAFIAECAP